VDQRLGRRAPVGQVERERGALHREREVGVGGGAAVLDDREERRGARRAQPLEQRRHRRRARRARQHALVLQEAAAAVEAVPLPDRIERIEEAVVGDDPAAQRGPVAPRVEAVEAAHEERIQQPLRRVERHAERQRGAGPARAGLDLGGVAAPHQDPAADVGPAGEAVDPAHRVGPVRRAQPQALHHRAEARHALGLQHDPRALDPLEPQGDLHDEAGEPHAAEGGEEQLALPVGTALDEPAVGNAEGDAIDEAPERAVAVMVLAVDVAGHARPDGDELGARGDRREPPARHEDAQDLGEAQPRLAVEAPGRGLERADAVGPRALEHEAALARGQRGVAVGAAEPARHHRLDAGGEGELLGALHAPASHRVAPPARDLLQHRPSAQLLHRATHAGAHSGP
jgi:hypothetical protein